MRIIKCYITYYVPCKLTSKQQLSKPLKVFAITWRKFINANSGINFYNLRICTGSESLFVYLFLITNTSMRKVETLEFQVKLPLTPSPFKYMEVQGSHGVLFESIKLESVTVVEDDSYFELSVCFLLIDGFSV